MRSRSASNRESSKQIPAKCDRCALLSMAEVRSLHGAAGDGCYVTKVCRSRRSYARHRNLRNQTRRQRWHETSSGTNGAKAETQPTAQLIVYRATRYNAPIDGIAAEVRQGKTKLATVQPVYCLGLLPKQIEAYIEAMWLVLQQDYGIDKFAGVVQQLPRSWQELKTAKQRSPRHREIKIDLPGVTDSYSAVLEICRQPETAAVIALKTAVWRGATPESGTPFLDCRGLLPSQIHAYLGQVLALLQSRYSIRWFARQVQQPLESCLPWLGQTEQTSEGESEPEVTLDLDPLWRELETSLQQRDLPPVQALEVAAEGISQIVLQFAQFAELAFEELEAVAERGVILAEDVFDQYVRQTMEVDFEQFIEPLATLPRKHSERQEIREGNSVVGELNQAAVLQVLDEQMSQEPELTESEIFNGALALAHEEDASAWGGMIAQWMQEHQSSLPLMELVQAMQMPLLNTWLGVLLSDEFVVEQRGQFYDLTSVWITVITHSDQFTESKSMPTRP
ncbi:MAG: hypothetical protein KME27_20900 [Lyngbya sp. HA4199-MV5]|nr:hypothetical protein [Lyngbya sp. HA4199-MV5]